MPELQSSVHRVSTASLKDGKIDPRAAVIFHVTIIPVNKGDGVEAVCRGIIMSRFSQTHSGELGPSNSMVSQFPATPGSYGIQKRRIF